MNDKKVMRIQRATIGAIAFILPFLLLIFAGPQKSISFTYHTTARDLFTTAIVAAGFVMITYRGYDRGDYVMTNLSGAFGVALALVPCFAPVGPIGFLQLAPKLSGIIHTTAAALFFASLAYICGFQFTKSDKHKILYMSCAVIMGFLEVCMILVTVFNFENGSIFFWMEAAALWAFGVAWLVKGLHKC
jgi:hypothetical protein